MNINFILAQFEQRSKKSGGPMFSVFFMEKNETVRRKIPAKNEWLKEPTSCMYFVF